MSEKEEELWLILCLFQNFIVILIGPFAMVRLEKEQAINELIPHIPEAAPVAVKIRLAAY